jgi:hypothetical protein
MLVYDCKYNGKLNFIVYKQGGMSNEMYNTIARVTDGIYEGIFVIHVKLMHEEYIL